MYLKFSLVLEVKKVFVSKCRGHVNRHIYVTKYFMDKGYGHTLNFIVLELCC